VSVVKDQRHRLGERGQVLVLAALSMVALLAMVALIIDGGNAFAQQRITQNGADASAEAGAVVLMQKLVGVPNSEDAAVETAVRNVADVNHLQAPVLACYTDLSGIPLAPAGGQVADCSAAAGAAQVGGGVIPPCAACPGSTAAGVRVYGSRSFGTFFAHVIGIDTLSASASATAIAGYVQAYPGAVIPVTIPVDAQGCDNTGATQPVVPPQPWEWGPARVLAVPLCKNGAGNVGWLDWNPPAGGASELASAILNSTNPPITTPKWYHVAATGSISGSPVQSAMDFWNGKNILVPIFSHTCSFTAQGVPLNWSVTNPIGQYTDCAGAGGTLDVGTGTNQWYFLVGFAQFHLNRSFINGGDGGQCSAFYGAWGVPAGNIDSCLIGYFTGLGGAAVFPGYSVGAGGGSSNQNSTPGVQLIR
jgi:hypothetical protein